MHKPRNNDDLPLAVENFEKLPPNARLNSRAVRVLFGIESYSTFSRRRKDGTIPDPDCSHGTWSKQLLEKLLESSFKNQSGRVE